MTWLGSGLLVPALLLGSPAPGEEQDPSAALARIAASFGASSSADQPLTSSLRLESRYVSMPDGVALAVDVLLPEGLSAGAKFPAILELTSFWRRVQGQEPDPMAVYLAERGYAFVRVDLRGTGASFGARSFLVTPGDLADGRALIEWIASRSWCNGRVGLLGRSTPGGTVARLLARAPPPTVRAAVLRFPSWDLYRDLTHPGGVLNEVFLRRLTAFQQELDRGSFEGLKVSPVDEDPSEALLDKALDAHARNGDSYSILSRIVSRDDLVEGVSLAELGPEPPGDAPKGSGVPLFLWGSWFDGATGDAVIRAFATTPHVVKAVVGAWSHDGLLDASPYRPRDARAIPPPASQWRECRSFFDRHLRSSGSNGEENATRALLYRTLGEGKWKATGSWPPPGVVTRRYYFRDEFSLSPDPPDRENFEHRYGVDYGATTGTTNRWASELGGGDVVYEDRDGEELMALTFTSEPFEDGIEITGQPVVTLEMSSSEPDAAVFVYLEDVSPEGSVSYLTEGCLRLLHRKREPGPEGLTLHSYSKDDASPLTPGETETVTVALLPVSVRLPAGHRVRIALTGHDADTFARIPEEGDPILSVECDQQRASFVDLPVVER